MASRDLSNFNTISQQVVENPSGLANIAAEIGTEIIRRSQQAKINENLSKAQLELNALDNQFRLDAEADPFNKTMLTDYEQRRKDTFAELGQNISPFFRGSWNDSVRDLANRSDLANQAWGFKQSHVNTVNSVNSSIKADMSLAAESGRLFADGSVTDFETILNFRPARDRLQEFATSNLGQDEATELLETYEEDYLKSFISGVAETNPVRALQIMREKAVVDSFSDTGQFSKFKSAIENRALQVNKINSQNELLDSMASTNGLMSSTLTEPMSYAQLQLEFERNNISSQAQAYYLKANGFTKDSAALSNNQKVENKIDIYDAVGQILNQDTVTAEDISVAQDKVYAAMDNKSITRDEGIQFIDQLLTPLVEQKREKLEDFGNPNWFTDSLGFDGIEEFFEDNVKVNEEEIILEESFFGDETQKLTKTERAERRITNNANRLKLFDLYAASLTGIASSYSDKANPGGIEIGNLNKLSSTQRNSLYRQAQSEAQRLFIEDRHPLLRTAPDIPNLIFSGGRLIQGMAGQRNIKPDKTVTREFEIIEKDGIRAFRFPDGRIEVIGGTATTK